MNTSADKLTDGPRDTYLWRATVAHFLTFTYTIAAHWTTDCLMEK